MGQQGKLLKFNECRCKIVEEMLQMLSNNIWFGACNLSIVPDRVSQARLTHDPDTRVIFLTELSLLKFMKA